MGIFVRRIRPTDGAALKAIRLQALLDAPSAFGSSHAREVGRADDEWERRAQDSAVGDRGVLLLAFRDEQAIGLVGAFRPDDAPEGAELISMWVAPGERRLGVAGRLVRAVVDWWTTTDAESLMLWVTDGNEPALRLYESIGFEDAGERRRLPSDPGRSEIRMRLHSAPPAR